MPVLIINLWGYPDPLNPAAQPQQVAVAAADGGVDESAPLQPPSASADAAVLAAAAILSGDTGSDGPSLCPTELTAYLDAEAAYAYLSHDRQLPAESILVHGVSIGGAIGASVALNHPGVRLTLDQPFCTLKEVTRHMTHGVVEGVVSRYLQARARSAQPAVPACPALPDRPACAPRHRASQRPAPPAARLPPIPARRARAGSRRCAWRACA